MWMLSVLLPGRKCYGDSSKLILWYFTPSVSQAAEPSNPTISTTRNGPAVSGPVMFSANQTVSFWCNAMNIGSDNSRQLQGLFWQDNNSSRLRRRGHMDNPNPDVYTESVAGSKSPYSPFWTRALHFDSIQPSYTGVYKCTANYNGVFTNAAVEILGG